MSTERTPTTLPRTSSRRFACDRCRLQKARCLREHADQARCDRCVRADAGCVTSPICRRRSWQIIAYDSPSQSVLGEATTKRRRRGQQDQDLSTPSEPSAAPGTQFVNSSHSTAPFYSMTQPLQESSAQHTAGDDERFGAMFSQPTDPSLNYLPDSLGLSDDFFMPETLSAAQTGPHVSSVPSCDYSDFGRTASPYVTGLSPKSNDPTPKPGGDGSPGSNNSSDTLQQDADSPFQQLSRLDYELVTLLTFLGKGRPHVTMDTLISPIDNSKSSKPAVDEILNRTREFVDVLETISEHQNSSAVARIPQKPSRRRPHQSDTSYGSSETDRDTPSDSSTKSVVSTTSSLPTKSDARPTAALDSASLLAILTVYLRVLRLHLVIFTNVYDLLKEVSESDDPVLCPVPGLNFSSFPIRESPLSASFAVQALTLCLQNPAICRQSFSSKLSPAFLSGWRRCLASRASFALEVGSRNLLAYLGSNVSWRQPVLS